MKQEKTALDALLAKVVRGEANDEEKEQVRRWMHQLDMPDNSASEIELQNAKQHMLHAILNGQEQRQLPAAHAIPAAHRIWKRIAVSAAVLLFVIAGALWLPSHITSTHQLATAAERHIHTDSTVKYIRLPDGSGVWLNAHSTLSYNSDSFAVKERHIQLDGEAYFEVKSYASKPFRVTSGGITTRVLGTGFNVQTYLRDSAVKITLVHGSIAVDNHSTGKSTLLRPHQQLQYHTQSGNWNVVAYDHNPAQHWMNGNLSFKDAMLSEVLDDLAHRYNVTIRYNHQMAMHKKVTIDINNQNHLETVLQSILYVHRLHYTYKNGQVFIY